MKRIALYPGSFDPLTNGHLDIMRRSLSICDSLIVGIAINKQKKPFFSVEERISLIKDAINENKTLNKENKSNISVKSFDSLLINFSKENNVSMIIRGLRVVSDFDYEFQMAGMNSRLSADIQTVFLMASENNQFIASRFVKEVASLNGDISSFVPKNVYRAIKQKFNY